MIKNLLLIFLVTFSASLYGQTYTMQNGNFTTCGGLFYDSGGDTFQYQPNENYQITFCPPTPGSYVQLTFTTFDIEGAPYDIMNIYEGTGTGGTLIGSYGGFVTPAGCSGGTITSSDPSGCLTITFVSDGVVELLGWAANISCTPTAGGVATGPSNAVCSGAAPFCADAGTLEFPNVDNADCVPDAPPEIPANTCLGSAPNPAWYYLEIDTPGNLTLEIEQTTGPGGTGTGLDVDFALWGPYPDTTSACADFTLGNVVACSYSIAPIETAIIPNAQTGEIYMVLITNFNGSAGYITMTQTNAGNASAGSTDCSIVCPVAVGTNPTCGASNGSITISGLAASTSYIINYIDDGTPVAVTLAANASGQAVISGLNAGNYTNIITNFPGCAGAFSNVVLAGGTPPVFNNVTSNTPICSGNNAVFTLSGTANATVTYTINSGALQTVVLNAGGTASISVNGVSANTIINITQISFPATGCTASVNVSHIVTVTQPPTANISYSAASFCNSAAGSQPVTLTGTGAYTGGTFSSAPGGLTIDTTTGAVTSSTSTAGNYTISYNIPASGGCPAVTATSTINITASATASINYSSAGYCTTAGAQSVTLTGTGTFSGGTFTSSPIGLTINPANGTITPSTSTAGSYTITYSAPGSAGCGPVSATTTVNISANATASISYSSAGYCTTAADQLVTLTGTGSFSGGTFSSSPVGLTIDAVTGGISPSTSNAGSYTITYSAPGIAGCGPVSATTTVNISANATASISYSSAGYCTTAADQSVIMTGTGLFSGGTFSSSPVGLTIDAVTGTISPSMSIAGNYTITYSAPGSAGCGPVSATTTVNISANATASISYSSAGYCTTAADQSVTLTGTGSFSGGTFSSLPIGLTIDGVTGTISPSTSTAGSYTITYSAPGSAGCGPVSATTTVNISANATASISYSSAGYCTTAADQTVTLTGTGSFSGGTFSSSPVGLTIDAVTGTISPSTSTAGIYMITYSAPGSGGCGPVSATTTVNISANATASISYSSAGYCTTAADQSVIMTGTGSFSGGTFSSLPVGLTIDGVTGTISPSTSSAGSYTITYSAPGSAGCGPVSATTTVNISANATASISYSSAGYCTTAADQSVTLTGTGSFSGGTFSSSPVGLTIDAVTGDISPSTSNAGSYTTTYSAPGSAGCGPVSATTTVNISANATASISYSSAGYCTTAADQSVILTGTGSFSGGTFSSSPVGLTIDAVTGGISPSTSNAGSYTITYSAPGSAGCGPVSATTTVNISANATAGISYSSAGYCTTAADQSVTLTGTGSFSGGTFSSLPVGLTIDAVTGAILPSTSTAGSYTITYSAPGSAGCGPVSATTTVNISANATASISYSSSGYCTTAADQSVTLTGTGSFSGGTFSSSPIGLTIDGVTGAISPSTSTAGSFTITYSAPGSAGCGPVSATTTVNISANATASINYPSAGYCTTAADQSVILTGTGSFSGGTFSSSSVGLTIDAVTGTISPSTSTAGSYTITYSAPGTAGCGPVSATTTVNISANATASISYSSAGYCTTAADQSVILTGTGSFSGGTFSPSPIGLTIDAVTGTISPSSSTAGIYMITYSAPGSAGCGPVSATTTVNISANATANISYPSAGYCTTAADQSVILTGTGSFSGGTFSSSPIGLTIDAVTGDISPSTSNAGSYTITYSAPGSAGCGPVSATTTVNISANATANISYPSAGYCTTAADQSVILTGTGSFSGGTFSSSPIGLTIDGVTGGISPSTSTAGSYTITYSAPGSAGCGPVSATTTVNISANATASISYSSSGYCTTAADQSVTLTGTGSFSGGTFSSLPVGLTIDAVTGAILPSTSTAGSYTITYSAPGSAGCGPVSATTTVNISANATASISYSSSGYCTTAADQSVTLTGTGSFSGGTFSSSPIGLTIDGVTGAISPSTSTAGSFTITYSAPGSAGCGPVSATTTVNISANATASINYSSAGYCTTAADQSVILTGTGSFSGGTFSSLPIGLTINAVTGGISPSTSTAGSYTITYSAPGSAGCGPVSATTTVNISANATASISYSSAGYCTTAADETVALTGTGSFSGGTFSSSPVGLTIDAVTGTISPSTSTAGIYMITYSAPGSAGCGPVSATTTVNISANATANISYSSAGYCTTAADQSVILTGTGSFSGGTFSSLPIGLTIDAVTGTISPSTSTAGSYTITYTSISTNTCLTLSSTFIVTIVEQLTIMISYTSNDFCLSATIQGVTMTGSGSFTGGSFSALPSGLIIDPITGSITPSASLPGNYSITYSLPANGNCNPLSVTTFVSISDVPTVNISYNSNDYCASDLTQSVLLTGTNNYTGGTFSSSPAGLTINTITGALTPSTSDPGNYLISYATPGNSGCPSVFATVPVTIYPGATVVPVVSSSSICSGSTAEILLSSFVPGTTFNWTVTSNNISGASDGSGPAITQILNSTTNVPGTAIYTITPTANGCIGTPINVMIIVNPIPVPQLSDGTICIDALTGDTIQTIVLNAGLNNSNHNFQWFLDGVIISGETNSTHIATLPGIYTVIATSNAGCISAPVNATVSAVTVGNEILVSGNVAFAEENGISFTVNGSGTFEYQVDNGNFTQSNTFFGLSPGSHTITVRDLEGCTLLTDTFTIIGYPHYFTPNGDGIHDTWNIIGAANVYAKIYIFDRYGKFLKQISPDGLGWDGTFNGASLPSTDYWFTVDYIEFSQPKTFTAHFSLKR